MRLCTAPPALLRTPAHSPRSGRPGTCRPTSGWGRRCRRPAAARTGRWAGMSRTAHHTERLLGSGSPPAAAPLSWNLPERPAPAASAPPWLGLLPAAAPAAAAGWPRRLRPGPGGGPWSGDHPAAARPPPLPRAGCRREHKSRRRHISGRRVRCPCLASAGGRQRHRVGGGTGRARLGWGACTPTRLLQGLERTLRRC